AQAAREIKALIADSVAKVEDGARLVDDTGRTMEDVVGNFQKLAALVAEIAGASAEQASGIDQVTHAVGQMDEITQQNAALVEEAAAAAESLEEQARALAISVGMFRLSAADKKTGETREWKPASLDFDGVIQAHMQWKYKLRNYLAGEGEALDPEVVGRDDKCALGCWIHGEGQHYSHDPAYGTLRDKHADFHRCAASVIRKKLAGDEREAQRLLLEDFTSLSEQTVQEIRTIKQKYGSAADQSAAPAAAPARRAPQPAAGRNAPVRPAVQDEWEEF
ncbi:MAG: hypothetical protein HGA47_11420, partial [Zoogloea sp.]|nr:hypothetical protein [Zoogloea sp.]